MLRHLQTRLIHAVTSSACTNPSRVDVAPRAATTPIAIGIAQGVGGEQSLTAAFAILAGILVAMGLHHLRRLGREENWPALGAAAGMAGSGIGTARAFQLSEVAGAFAGLALGVNELATAVFVPILVHLEKLWRFPQLESSSE
jgi:putative effector of murein hydrolase